MINEDEVKNWLSVLEKWSSRFDENRQNGGDLFERLNELTEFLKELNEFMANKVTNFN